MNNNQRARLDACNRVKDYTTRHAADLATIPEMAAELVIFNNYLSIIKNAAQTQTTPSGAANDTVAIAKLLMTTTVIKFALRASVKAKQLGNVELYNKLNHPATYILQAPKTLALSRANELKQEMNDNLATLTNIVAANMTDMTNAIKGYNDIKDNPRNNIETKAATGTDVLPAAFTAIFSSIDNIFDLVYSYYYDSKKSLVDELALNRQIINTGVRHSGIEGYVYENGAPSIGVIVMIDGTNKSGVTDINGHYSIIKVKTGDYFIRAKNTGNVFKTEKRHISRGVIDNVDFNF